MLPRESGPSHHHTESALTCENLSHLRAPAHIPTPWNEIPHALLLLKNLAGLSRSSSNVVFLRTPWTQLGRRNGPVPDPGTREALQVQKWMGSSQTLALRHLLPPTVGSPFRAAASLCPVDTAMNKTNCFALAETTI